MMGGAAAASPPHGPFMMTTGHRPSMAFSTLPPPHPIDRHMTRSFSATDVPPSLRGALLHGAVSAPQTVSVRSSETLGC